MASTTKCPPLGTAAAAFDKASDIYERMTGGCTREVAKYILTLDPKVDSSSIILDNACGTGIITEEILNHFSESRPRISAADFAPSMVSNFTTKAKAKGWITDGDVNHLTVSVQNAEELTYPDESFTHSYTNLGFPFFADGEKAAAQLYRTLRPNGTAFISTWKTLGYLQPIHRAQLAVRLDSTPWEPLMPKEWLTKEKLVRVLVAGGFEPDRIEVHERTVGYRGKNLEALLDIMKMSFLGQVTDGWNEEEKLIWVKELRESLTEDEKMNASVEMVAWVAVATK
ncbi:hypothetical protein BDV12DRAFT_172123 [Aspergillus spectabilis]